MHIDFLAAPPAEPASLVIPVRKAALTEALTGRDHAEALRATANASRFEGEVGAVVHLIVVDGGIAQRIVLLGIGDGSSNDAVKAGSALTAKYLTSGDTSLALAAQGLPMAALMRLVEGAVLRAWRYDRYRTTLPTTQRPTLHTIVVFGGEAGAADTWTRTAAVIEGVAFARDLVTQPPNVLYPESFADQCRGLADLGLGVQVLDEDAMAAAGMGALLGVGQGSVRASRLLVLKWDGSGDTQPQPLALVGKGVTFDTGGISLKPGPGMEDMKFDMGGAAAVVGAMIALAKRKARAHVIGICGLVENMPDGNAQRPGDVVTSMSGQTIEILNTDAEGRLVLCDCLTWVQKNHKPTTIVDLATLTGAMIVALGHEYGGMFANDDGLATQLSAAGAAVGDPLWRMPLGDAYNKLIDSPIADMKNVGPREAGSITAAQFLQRFVDDGVKWAHLDIAGMVWATKPGPGWDKGATGYGVRLLDRFVADNFEVA